MFQAWRWKIKAAEEAVERGELYEASRRLREDGLLEFLPARRLAQRVAERLVEQAHRAVDAGDTEAAWQVGEEVAGLVGESDALRRVRQRIAASLLQQWETQLLSGNDAAASVLLNKYAARGGSAAEAESLREVKRLVGLARQLAVRGKYAEAADQLARAAALQPTMKGLARMHAEHVARAAKVRQLSDRLHGALAAERWTDVASTAEQLLEIAPQMTLARDARRQAWATVAGRPNGACGETDLEPMQHGRRAFVAGQEQSMGPSAGPGRGSRFLLWVDAVGAFLVSMEPVVTIGQAVPGNAVDLPILGDLSREHARVRRQRDGYVIEPLGEVWLRGQRITGPQPLADGDEIQLGSVVRLRFGQPHALSATARLDFVSRHRTPHPADAILLLAESCVLGPRKSNHVLCRDWSRDVILYRKDDTLFCRTLEPIEIDGQICDGRGPLTLNSHVAGEDFSLSLESI